ncbi:hypothetical protein KDA_47560 [Dictyobacter alpinus]|uniref:Polymerase nucleotidyl transferase domain-containing protein n=1 Tax=Dictyobacter alpinus TaxID=2014873 RepID=A0A402BDB5_9CHLR|nr:nucleotidyltransferase domain-containing protein [Dictyobacter alpinus]GCE29272.1 hypothetical protein KDA_47560 [Dictyobacter alpinus]
MEKHHEEAIQRLIERFQDDPRYPALIISGSVAHGSASPASDIDILLVASDEEYQRLAAAHQLVQIWTEGCDWPGGYYDVKIINHRFLIDAADHGSEPIRYALHGAYPTYSHLPGLPALIQSIASYPEHERERKMAAYYAQVQLYRSYFIHTATDHNNLYLLHHTANNLVLFAGRLLLAYNRVLFPCHKWLLDTVARLNQKPENFIELAEALLRNPSIENAHAFGTSLDAFHDWNMSYDEALNRFVEDDEWGWFTRRPALTDW